MKSLKLYALMSALIFIPNTPAQAQSTMQPTDMPPLMPVINCENHVCDVRFSGVFEGQTLITDPLPMKISVKDTRHWQPRIRSNEVLKMDSETAPFGWLIGDNETEMELYLTPLAEKFEEYNARHFMVEQRAGFEHVGIAYRFYVLRFDKPGFATALALGPNAGSQMDVTSANMDGVRVKSQAYDPETGDFIPHYEQYEWYSGANSPLLGTEEDMADIYAQEDIMMNEPSQD